MSEQVDGLQIHWVDAALQAVSLQPGDVLVLMHPGKLYMEAMPHIKKLMEERFPGHKVLVLEEGMRLGVLRPEGEESTSKLGENSL